MDLDYFKLLIQNKEVKIREHTCPANPYNKEFNLSYRLNGVTVNVEITYNRIRNKYMTIVVDVGRYCAGYYMSYLPLFKELLPLFREAYPEIDGIASVFREEYLIGEKDKEQKIADISKKAA